MERNPYLRKERQHDGGQEGKMLNAALRSNEDKLVEKSKDRRRTEDRRKKKEHLRKKKTAVTPLSAATEKQETGGEERKLRGGGGGRGEGLASLFKSRVLPLSHA